MESIATILDPWTTIRVLCSTWPFPSRTVFAAMTMRLLICMCVEVEIKRTAQTQKMTFEIRMIRPPPRDTCLLSHQSENLHVVHGLPRLRLARDGRPAVP